MTAREAVELDEDMPILVRALERVGRTVRIAVWDDPAVDWSSTALTVVRSTWDYASRRDEFVAWADAAARVTRVVNSPSVLRWNTDKRYLADLADLGVPVVPSTFHTALSDLMPSDLMLSRLALPASGDVVIKPSIGAGSHGAARFAAGDVERATAHAAALLAEGQTVLVQPYQAAVDDFGEVAAIFFGGVFSHAINKGPLLRPGAEASRTLFADELITAHFITTTEREVAESVIAALRALPEVGTDLAAPAYARVDLLRADDGRLLVLELELTEPSVFLDTSSGGADRFAAVLSDELAGAVSRG